MRQKIKKGCCVAGETDRAAAAAGAITHIYTGGHTRSSAVHSHKLFKVRGGIKGPCVTSCWSEHKSPLFNCATVCSSGHHGRREVLLQPHRRPPLCSPYSHCILLQPTHYFASTGFSFVLSTQFTFITILYLKQKTLQIFLSSYLE